MARLNLFGIVNAKKIARLWGASIAFRSILEMIKIPLTKGKESVVDDCDSHLLAYKWMAHSAGYACRTNYKVSSCYLHHVIMGKPINGDYVDHVDGDKLNNRRSNLRIAKPRLNAINKSIHRNGRACGVWFRKNRSKWISFVKIKGKRKYIGMFTTAEEASKAYLKYCQENNLL